MDNKNKEINRLNKIYEGLLGRAGVAVEIGHGVLSDKNTVAITRPDGSSATLTAETIVLAVGGWPFKPQIPGIEHAITSNEVFYLPDRPKRVVVVGGGYIAVEFVSSVVSHDGKRDGFQMLTSLRTYRSASDRSMCVPGLGRPNVDRRTPALIISGTEGSGAVLASSPGA